MTKMKIQKDLSSPEVASVLNSGGIVVLRTDTIYGVVARADNEQAVRRVYELKGRDETKSPIVLIANTSQLFDTVSEDAHARVRKFWPGKTSIIFPSNEAPAWIRRSNRSVAYRLPNNDGLRELLQQTGPLIAPSANPQGTRPAMNIEEAVTYFGDKVDLYIDGGQVDDNTPSRLFILHENGEMEQLR